MKDERFDEIKALKEDYFSGDPEKEILDGTFELTPEHHRFAAMAPQMVKELVEHLEFLRDKTGITLASESDKVIFWWMETSFHSHKEGYRNSTDPLDIVNWVTSRGWEEIRQVCAVAELLTEERLKNLRLTAEIEELRTDRDELVALYG